MVSFLSMINGYLSYINLNIKIKNRIYTAMATVGNIYLLYVSYRFFSNGYWGRGILFILAFLAIAYFAYLNILYYFTDDKQSKYDISPWIEKTFHLQAKDPLADAEKNKNVPAGFVQTNGIFEDQDFLPADITFTDQQKLNLEMIVEQLEAYDYIHLDYGNQSEASMFAQAQKGEFPHALAQPVALPYFDLAQNTHGELVIVGGLNQMQRKELGTVETVGLLPASQALKRYHLYLATVMLTGGPYRTAGRTSTVEKLAPFTLESRLAYRQRGKFEQEVSTMGQDLKAEESRVEEVLRRADQQLKRRR